MVPPLSDCGEFDMLRQEQEKMKENKVDTCVAIKLSSSESFSPFKFQEMFGLR